MSNKKCINIFKNGYEEVHVPASKPKPFADNQKLIPINELPMWIHETFKGTKTLNCIQSQIYSVAFEQGENLLVCVPTGSGKIICCHSIINIYVLDQIRINKTQ